MWIASCTKLMTAIAALQCVEKGLLHLDDDISNVMPEWEAPSILLGFDDAKGEPILEKAREKITLRRLLSHQSGMGYAFTNPLLEQYSNYKMERGEMDPSRFVCNLSPVQTRECLTNSTLLPLTTSPAPVFCRSSTNQELLGRMVSARTGLGKWWSA